MADVSQWFWIAFLVISSLGMLFCLVGIINPWKIWYWREGWKYKNTSMVEPSDTRLLGIRIASVIGSLVCAAFIVGASLLMSGNVGLFNWPGFPGQ